MNQSVEKRFLSLLLAFVMVLSLLPGLSIEAFADQTMTHTIDSVGVSVVIPEGIVNGKTTLLGSCTFEGTTINATVQSHPVYTEASQGCGGVGATPAEWNYKAKTITITLTNNSGMDAIIRFAYKGSQDITIANVNKGTGGNYESAKIASGGKITISMTSGIEGTGDINDKTSGVGQAYDLVLSGISLETRQEVTITFAAAENGTYTVDGEAASVVGSKVVATTDEVALVATPNSVEYVFAGWKDIISDNFIGLELSSNIKFRSNMTIAPVFLPASNLTYVAFVTDVSKGARFSNLSDALVAASTVSGSVVAPLTNVKLEMDYTIPAGVTFLVPFNDAYKRYGAAPLASAVPDTGEGTCSTPEPYRTVTINDGVTITVDGSIELAANHWASHGGGGIGGRPQHYYGHIVMEGSSQIILNSGASLYAWGYITGAKQTDEKQAVVTANSGAKIYEKMQVTDYRGGSITTGALGALTGGGLLGKKIFPFNQYYIQNVEVKEVIKYGATLICNAAIYASSVESNTVDFMGANAMFVLQDGAQATKYYDAESDRLILDVEGTMSMNAISIMGYDTSEFTLPLNNNLTINIKSGGNAVINQHVQLLPGAVINVEAGGKLTLNSGKKAYLLDEDQWDKFCMGQKIKQLTYVAGRKAAPVARDPDNLGDAILNINGELVLNGALYTSTGNAQIISSGKSGKISVKTTVPTATTSIKQSLTITWTDEQNKDITMYPAVLTNVKKDKNGNPTTTPTSGTAAGKTFYYYNACEMWVLSDADHTQHPDAEDDGNHNCDTCEENNISDHIPGPEATCTTDQICTDCKIVLAEKLGHTYTNDCDRECDRCKEERDNPPHNYVLGTTEVVGGYTWTADGKSCTAYATCPTCGDTTTATVTSSGAVKTAATCLAKGLTTYTATFSDVYWATTQTMDVEDIAQLSHSYTGDYKINGTGPDTTHAQKCVNGCDKYGPEEAHTYQSVVTAPTCTEKGYTTYTCSACKNTYTGNEVAVLGHNYNNGEITTNPGCTSEGVKTYTCATCGHEYTEAVSPTGHTEGEIVVENNVAPDCVNAGSYDNVVYCTVCGEELGREKITVDALGHDYESVVTAPTCTEKGYTTYTCSICSDSYTTDEVAATGHSYTSEVTTAPTCTEKGVKTFTCTCGDSYTEELSAKGHTLTQVEAKAPTCTEAGYEAYEHCSECDYTTYKEVAATGHDYESVVTAPTCTEDGYTTYTCSVCGDTYTADVVNALGHTEGETVVENNVAPDCENAGSYDNVVYCTVCDAELSRETVVVDALGHTEGEIVVENEVAADCENTGSYDNVTYCTVCGEELSRETITVDALGHTEGETVVENNVDSDCVNAGSYDNVVYCTVCDAELSRKTITVDALGHSYDAVVTAPTCTEDGYTTYTCSVCSDSYTADEVAATGHSYTSEVTTAPTCTEKGVKTFTCTCGDSYTEELSAKGHTLTQVEAKAPTCTEAGYEAYEHCSECDYTTYKEVAATGHDYESVVTAPTCTEDGYTTYTCSVCGDTYTADVVDALGHTEVTDAAVAPTCTETGLTEGKHCSACNEVLAAQEVVDALGHQYEAVVTAPTCTDEGYTTYTCSVCGDTYTADEVAPLGHRFTDGEKDTDCNYCSYTRAAYIGDVNYVTLDEALAAVQAGETVVVLKQIVIEGDVRWDLTGTTLDVQYVNNQNYALVVKGNLTIEGGSFNFANIYGIGVTATGNLIINGGKFTTPADYYLIGSYGNTTINDGEFEAVYCNVNGFEGTLNINGGTYTITDKENGSDVFAGDGVANITGGDFSTDVSDYCAAGHTMDADANGRYLYETHTYTSVVTKPNCTEQGYTTHTCACGDSYADSYVNATGHLHTYKINAKEATPYEEGYTGDTFCHDCQTVIETGSVIEKVTGAKAMVGEEWFFTLADAMAAAKNTGEAIVLIDNITLVEKLTVEGTQIWNFNGYTLTIASVADNYGMIIKGDLTINGGNFVVSGMYGIGVQPAGKLTINDGVFKVTGNNDYLIGNWGTVIINNGSFTGQYCCVNNFAGTTTINGGSFKTAEFDASGEYPACDVLADSGLTVTGGEFSKDVTEYCAVGYHTIDQDADGVYTYEKHRYGGLRVFTFCEENGYIQITCPDCDNTYDSRDDEEAKKYLIDMPFFNLNPQGHLYEDDFDASCNRGDCGHVRSDAKVLIAMIGEQKFDSLAEAVAVAKDGETIVLYKDVELSEKLTVNTKQIWNFGSYTVKLANGDENYSLVIKGDLTIDSGNFVASGWYGIGVNGSLTVNGGSFSYEGYNDYLIGNWGKTEINNGDFESQYCCVNNFAGTTTINGGNFRTAEFDASGEYPACDVLADSGLTVTGGTFSKDVTWFCVDGFHTVKNGNGQYVYGNHYYNPRWETDSEFHWHVCACGDIAGKAEHRYEDDFDAYCDECDYHRSDAKPLVAMIGNVKYESFTDAVAAAKDGDTIYVYDAFVLTEKLIVNTKQTWIIPDVIVELANVADNYALVVKSELTISGGAIYVPGWYGIGVTGKLTIEDTILKATGDNDYLIGNWGTTIINGGRFTGQYCCVNNFAGTTTINGGRFKTAEFDASGEYESCDLMADSGLTVTGGTFSKDVTQFCGHDYHTVDPDQDGTYVYGTCIPGTPAKENEIPATTLTPGSYELVTYCTVCGKELSHKTENVQTKLETEGFKEDTVPDSIQSVIQDMIQQDPDSVQGETVVEQLEHIMTEAVNNTETIQDIIENNPFVEKIEEVVHEVIDIVLQYTNDGGKTWQKADEEHFPADGRIEVILPVPEGTSWATHTYIVAHMFSSDSFGKTVGDIEYPELSKYLDSEGNEYIQFFVTGLSPMDVTYAQTNPCGKGHTEGETVVENNVDPTCTATGSYDNVVYCTVCDAELSRETVTVDALGHKYESVVTAPTCTEDGYTTYTCSVCSDSYMADEVAATGHTEVTDAAVEAGCENTGLTEGTHCSVCNKVIVAQEVVDALGHTEGKIVVENNVNPDCVNSGSYDNVVYCTVCGEELSRETVTVDALGHNHEGVVTTEPTCTEKGVKTFTCTCGDSYTEEIAAKGHSFVDDDCEVCNTKLVTAPENMIGTYAVVGNILTVTSDAVYRVGCWNGTTYIPVEAEKNEDGSYRFEIPENTQNVRLVLVGDINYDGKLTAADCGRLNAYAKGKIELDDPATLLICDVDKNGVVNSDDVHAVLNSVLGKANLAW